MATRVGGWHKAGGTVWDNDPFTEQRAREIGASFPEGCPWRGSYICLECPLAENCDTDCKWQCVSGKGKEPCPERQYCPCGDDQTGVLFSYGAIDRVDVLKAWSHMLAPRGATE